MAAEGCYQLLVVGAGDVHAAKDSRLGGVAVWVEGQVQPLHGRVAGVVEHHDHNRQVALPGYAQCLGDGVVNSSPELATAIEEFVEEMLD